MTIDRVEFSSLMASRLCHDLLSPVGAFANGLELLADEPDPDMRARVFELLEQSARTSANKLKFFRLAFGSAGGFGEKIPPEEARDVIQGLINDAKPITLQWMPGDELMPKPVVKVVLNLALILVEGLVRGGTLVVGCERGANGIEIALRAEGERVIIDEQVEKCLSEGGVAMTSRTAPAVLVLTIVEESGGRLMLSREAPNAVLVGAVLPNV